MNLNTQRYLQLALLPLLLAILYPYYHKSSSQSLQSDTESKINPFLSSKANYHYSPNQDKSNNQYELIGFEGVFRHGTRHLNSEQKVQKAVDYFKKLDKKGLLSDPQLLDYIQQFADNEMNVTGKICERGEDEVRGISARLLDRWQNKLLSFPIHTTNTFKLRTQETQASFLSVFYDRNQTVNIQMDDGKECTMMDTESDLYQYGQLRYYDLCPAYEDYKLSLEKSDAVDASIHDLYLNSYILPRSQSYLNESQLYQAYLKSSTNETYEQYVQSTIWKTITKLYSLCQIESSCHQVHDHLCSYLHQSISRVQSLYSVPSSEPLFSILNHYENMKQYYKKGPAHPATYQMSCVLLNHIVEHSLLYILQYMKQQSATQGEYYDYKAYLDLFGLSVTPLSYQAELHFSHAETLFGLYSLMNITAPLSNTTLSSSTSFDLYSLLPMAANIQFEVLYCSTCSSHYYLRILINEQPYSIPYRECKHQSVCPMKTFLMYYSSLYAKNNIRQCDIEEFKELCHGLVCPK